MTCFFPEDLFENSLREIAKEVVEKVNSFMSGDVEKNETMEITYWGKEHSEHCETEALLPSLPTTLRTVTIQRKDFVTCPFACKVMDKENIIHEEDFIKTSSVSLVIKYTTHETEPDFLSSATPKIYEIIRKYVTGHWIFCILRSVQVKVREDEEIIKNNTPLEHPFYYRLTTTHCTCCTDVSKEKECVLYVDIYQPIQ